VVFANGPFYTPTFPATGTPFTAQIIFWNVGNGKSPQYTVSLAVDDNLGDPQIPVDTESIPPLAPNQQMPVNFSVTAQQWDYFGLVFSIQQTGAGQTYEISTF
jgi:hypothetical protein